MSKRVTVEQAMRDLGKTRRCLEGWRKAGCPGFSKQGEMVFIDIEAVLDWMKSTGRKLGKKARVAPAPAPARETNLAKLPSPSSYSRDMDASRIGDEFQRLHFKSIEEFFWGLCDGVIDSAPGELKKRIGDLLAFKVWEFLGFLRRDLEEGFPFENPKTDSIYREFQELVAAE